MKSKILTARCRPVLTVSLISVAYIPKNDRFPRGMIFIRYCDKGDAGGTCSGNTDQWQGRHGDRMEL